MDNSNIKRIAVSPAEAALMLGISRSKVYELMEAGQLRNIKLGGRRLIPVSAINQLFTEAA